jgi:hypothetical protein
VTGYTHSINFPITIGAFDMTCGTDGTCNGGYDDTFVTRLDPSGGTLAYSTYLGGSSVDVGYGIAVDGNGAAYVTGYTISGDFPIAIGAFDMTCGTDGTCNGGDYDAFVARLDPSGGTLAYSTYLGGSSSDIGYGIAVDGNGAAYVTGWTLSSDFPVTLGAFDTSFNGGISDVFVTDLSPTGALLYSTFLGGSGYNDENGDGDHGVGIAVGGTGTVYVMGDTASSDFPTTLGTFDTSFSGGFTDVFVTKLGEAEACDGFDNDLDGLVDEDFPDTDGDGTADCVDASPLGVCGGVAVTILGTVGNDVINGTNGADVIDGGEGNDTIYGKGGNDFLCGSAGNDILRGSTGNDALDGGTDTDRCYGDAGTADTVVNCETVAGVP